MLNIYLVSRPYAGYDTYDSFVVCAETEQDARDTHPNGSPWEKDERYQYSWVDWPDRGELEVELIGTANDNQKPGVVVASFNAG